MTTVFSQLHPLIQEVLQDQGITVPTEPQYKAIPDILNGDHVLLIAPTGLGKTEAALLPVFHDILKVGINKKEQAAQGISILYITPLRALNRDMLRRTMTWGESLGLKIAVRHGDTTQSERARQSRSPPDMLITTPETFQILFTGKRLRKHLQQVKKVIIDEVHELATDERGAQLAVALERLQAITHVDFQRIGLSATVGTPSEVSRFLGGIYKGKPRRVKIVEVDVTKHLDLAVTHAKLQKGDHTHAQQLSMEPLSFSSLRTCYQMIHDHRSTLVFINTRDGAEILATRFHLWKKDYPIGVHHGSLSKQARIEAEDAFKQGKLQGLICTSSMELGIDVGDTDFVIQYNSPREVTRLVQRVGRSGHQVGKTSTGVILGTNPEDIAESVVIAKRALQGELEPCIVRQNPLSVLSNQIISIVLEYKTISKNKMYEIITQTYPFHTLQKPVFDTMITQLISQRSIWLDDDEEHLSTRRRSRQYFLDNISMIPDETTINVIEISSRSKIGTLDESFVLNYGFEGSTFILKGRPWVIIKREEENILVAQAKDMGNVPSWVGEDIPIPFKVAKEVGKLRRIITKKKKKDEYPWDTFSKTQFTSFVKKQLDEGLVLPDDKTITIEAEEKTIVINACFGTKVNETLGRLISALLAQSLGESVGINNDAYRITLEVPRHFPPQRIEKIMRDIQPESLEYILETIVRNSTYIRWELVHVARKFGALRKDFDYKNVGIKKLLTLFEQSIVFDEAIQKLLWERMDIENTKKVLQDIQKGDISIHIQKLSPIGMAGFETIRGLMVPQRADRTILMALQKRLDETEITLVCTNCFHQWDTRVSRAGSQPKCSRCGAIKITVLKRYNKNLAKILTSKTMTPQERKEATRLHKNASLVLGYGYYALLSLMGRGIGPDTAARILRKFNVMDLKKSEETTLRFLRDILQAELQYARTRGFWDNN